MRKDTLFMKDRCVARLDERSGYSGRCCSGRMRPPNTSCANTEQWGTLLLLKTTLHPADFLALVCLCQKASMCCVCTHPNTPPEALKTKVPLQPIRGHSVLFSPQETAEDMPANPVFPTEPY